MAQVSGTASKPKIVMCSVSYLGKLPPIFPVAEKNEEIYPVYKFKTITGMTLHAPLAQKTINLIRQLSSEGKAILYFLVIYLSNFCKSGKHITKQDIRTAYAELIKDPMLCCHNYVEYPERSSVNAFYSVNQLVRGVFDLNTVFRCIETNRLPSQHFSNLENRCLNISSKLTVQSSTIDEEAQTYEIGNYILSSQLEDPIFIDFLKQEVIRALQDQSLMKATLLRGERIFQRSSLLVQFYSPQYNRIEHRWNTVSLSELMQLKKGHMIKFAGSEDLGVLRDLVRNFGKLCLNLLQEEELTGAREIRTIKDLEKSVRFWFDPSKDKLLPGPGLTNALFPIDKAFLDPAKLDELLMRFCMLASELAQREKINLNELSSLIEEDNENMKLKKWVKLLKYSEIQYAMTKEMKLTRFSIEEFKRKNISVSEILENDSNEADSSEQDSEDENTSAFSEEVLSAHHSDSLKNMSFFISRCGSCLLGCKGSEFFSRKFAIFNESTSKYEFFYLEPDATSSFVIWNSAIYLYFSKNSIRNVSIDLKNTLHGQILWADLREYFETTSSNKKLIVFAPFLKDTDELMGRTLLADDQGIYLFGGSRLSGEKSTLEFSNNCNFYSLKRNRLNTSSEMNLKRDRLIAISNRKNIFVAAGSNQTMGVIGEKQINEVEIYDKALRKWSRIIKLQFEDIIQTYSFIRAVTKDTESALILLGRTSGKQIKGYVVCEETKIVECQKEGEEIVLKSLNSNKLLVSMPYSTFAFQNSYECHELAIGYFHLDLPQKESLLLERI